MSDTIQPQSTATTEPDLGVVAEWPQQQQQQPQQYQDPAAIQINDCLNAPQGLELGPGIGLDLVSSSNSSSDFEDDDDGEEEIAGHGGENGTSFTTTTQTMSLQQPVATEAQAQTQANANTTAELPTTATQAGPAKPVEGGDMDKAKANGEDFVDYDGGSGSDSDSESASGSETGSSGSDGGEYDVAGAGVEEGPGVDVDVVAIDNSNGVGVQGGGAVEYGDIRKQAIERNKEFLRTMGYTTTKRDKRKSKTKRGEAERLAALQQKTMTPTNTQTLTPTENSLISPDGTIPTIAPTSPTSATQSTENLHPLQNTPNTPTFSTPTNFAVSQSESFSAAAPSLETNDYQTFTSNPTISSLLAQTLPSVISSTTTVSSVPDAPPPEEPRYPKRARKIQHKSLYPPLPIISVKATKCHWCLGPLESGRFQRCSTCPCKFCSSCFNSNWEVVSIMPEWVCPVCDGTCSCPRCSSTKPMWYGHLVSDEVSQRMRLRLQHLLEKLISLNHAKLFSEPVDTKKFPDYTVIIDRPMDLKTISQKLERGEYSLDTEFADDVRLVWSNARKYNAPTSIVTKIAAKFAEKFEVWFDEMQRAEIAHQHFAAGGEGAVELSAVCSVDELLNQHYSQSQHEHERGTKKEKEATSPVSSASKSSTHTKTSATHASSESPPAKHYGGGKSWPLPPLDSPPVLPKKRGPKTKAEPSDNYTSEDAASPPQTKKSRVYYVSEYSYGNPHKSGATSLLDLRNAGLLAENEILTYPFKGTTHVADVMPSGDLKDRGTEKRFATPTAWTRFINHYGSSRFRFITTSDGRCLFDIKKEYEESMKPKRRDKPKRG
ncbi:nucleosome-remodeling factor subunit BPTF [Pelomyxa schiedti]|nr:nucleosome-remodeling factor subunit BPTF [Pelomyxa schiedti]